MSTAERIVRPFLGVDAVQQIVEGLSLRVGSDNVSDRERLVLSPHDYLTRPVDLEFAGDGLPLSDFKKQIVEGVKTLDLPLTAVEFVTIVSTQRLKLAEIVWKHPLHDLDSLAPAVTLANAARRPGPLLTPFGGCRVDVYLLLAQEIEAAPLRPWRKGTWLAHATFSISTDLTAIGFTPLALDDETRNRLGLPPGTNRFVRIAGSVLDAEVDEDMVELYVDKDLLGELATFSTTPGARAMQRQLFLDAANAIVLEALREEDLSNLGMEEIEGSLLARIVAFAADRVPGESEQALRNRRDLLLDRLESDPAFFLAVVEAQCRTKDDLSGALRAGAST